jgi:hypothetical protein
MFLKAPRASTDQRVRSLLQKAARRGYSQVVELALARLTQSGDRTWLRSRTVVITFEECWPLAALLPTDNESTKKRDHLIRVSHACKQKDAAALGALAYAYGEGDRSMLDLLPEARLLQIASEALKRPRDFFQWALSQSGGHLNTDIILSAQHYLSVATWPWDKACILAGALLAAVNQVPIVAPSDPPTDAFPYWVALDKHTPSGKAAIAEIAKEMRCGYRRLIWASFYCESARVNRLLESPWWNAERTWRLQRAGLSVDAAENLWASARSRIRERLLEQSAALKSFVEPISCENAAVGQQNMFS